MSSRAPTFILAALLGISSSASLQAESRTFTSPDGRTVEAEVQSASPDKVTLKLVNGQTIVTEVNRFSEADKVYIAEWRKVNPEIIKYDFSASYTKEKSTTTKSRSGNVQVTTENWLCNLKLTNKSGQTLEGVKVEYEIFYSFNAGPKPQPRKTQGSVQVPSIKSLEEVSLQTKSVELATRKLDGGFYFADGTRPRQKDEIDGVVIRVSHSNKTVFEWASQGLPADRGGIMSDERRR